MKKISVIIVTFNSQDYIAKCIDSVYKYNDIGDDLEIIIVDNSNTDTSKRMFSYLKSRYAGKIKCIRNTNNGGYGQGNNLGIKNSTGDIICIMNPDIILTGKIFGKIVKSFSSDENLGMIGLRQIGGPNFSFYFRPEYHIPIITLLLTRAFNRLNIYMEKYMYLVGALLFIRKYDGDINGIFDENIFMYNEEPDITRRLLNKNAKTIYNRKLHYIHNLGHRTTISKTLFDYRLRSLLYYLNKFKFPPLKYFRKLLLEEKIRIIIYTLFNEKHKLHESYKKCAMIEKYITRLRSEELHSLSAVNSPADSHP